MRKIRLETQPQNHLVPSRSCTDRIGILAAITELQDLLASGCGLTLQAGLTIGSF